MIDLTRTLKNLTPAQAWAVYEALAQFTENGADYLADHENDNEADPQIVSQIAAGNEVLELMESEIQKIAED